MSKRAERFWRAWHELVRRCDPIGFERPIKYPTWPDRYPGWFTAIWVTIFVLMAISIFTCNKKEACADTFHPSRVRLLVHGAYQFDHAFGISGHFIPAGNLLGELAPRAYLTLDWTPAENITISPCVGWSFKPDEVVASLRLTPRYKDFYGWIDFEVQPQSWSFYWFAQAEWKAVKWLHLGLEEESWGDFNEFVLSSHGGGPNVLFRFGDHVGIDLALHARGLDDEVGPEFFLRFHLFSNLSNSDKKE